MRKLPALDFQFALTLGETFLPLHDAAFLFAYTLAPATVVVAFLSALCTATVALHVSVFAAAVIVVLRLLRLTKELRSHLTKDIAQILPLGRHSA